MQLINLVLLFVLGLQTASTLWLPWSGWQRPRIYSSLRRYTGNRRPFRYPGVFRSKREAEPEPEPEPVVEKSGVKHGDMAELSYAAPPWAAWPYQWSGAMAPAAAFNPFALPDIFSRIAPHPEPWKDATAAAAAQGSSSSRSAVAGKNATTTADGSPKGRLWHKQSDWHYVWP
jgi:hypothetical protein